jgi:sugar/nucleoside kinase (ribokinase family)
VDARQKRGTFVRPRSDWNLLDGDVIRWQFAEGADPRLLDKLHEVRSIIEPAGARLAAHRATDAASDDELSVLTDSTDPVHALKAAGVQESVVKHGPEGATSHSWTGSVRLPSRRVPVVDTVGAGDAFVAGLLCGLLNDLDAETRLRRAVTAGAFGRAGQAGRAVATRGDWEGLPTRVELALLDQAPGSAVR